MMKLKDIFKWERRLAAWHEAGHVVAAHHFGLPVRAEIFRLTDPKENEKTWSGRAIPYEIETLRKCDRSVIGIAGSIAEKMLRERIVPELFLEDWQLGDVIPSPTDLKLIRPRWKERKRDVLRAVSVLQDRKYLFQEVLKSLERHEEVFLCPAVD